MASIPDDQLTLFYVIRNVFNAKLSKLKEILIEACNNVIFLVKLLLFPNRYINKDVTKQRIETQLRMYIAIAVMESPEFAWTEAIACKRDIHEKLFTASLLAVLACTCIISLGINCVVNYLTYNHTDIFNICVLLLHVLLLRTTISLLKETYSLYKTNNAYVTMLAYATYRHINITFTSALQKPNEHIQHYAPIQKQILSDLALDYIVAEYNMKQPSIFEKVFTPYQNELIEKIEKFKDNKDKKIDYLIHLELSYIFIKYIIGVPIEIPAKYSEEVYPSVFGDLLIKYAYNKSVLHAAIDAYSHDVRPVTGIFPPG